MLATYERKKVTEYTSFNYEFKVFYKDEYVSFCASSLAKWKDEKKVMLLKMDEYQKDVQMSLPFDSILIEVPH